MSRPHLFVKSLTVVLCLSSVTSCFHPSAEQASAGQAQTRTSDGQAPQQSGQAQTKSSLSELAQSSLIVDRHVLDTSAEEFLVHTGSGKFESYLAQSVSFEPVATLRSRIEQRFDVKLKHRGEAHITVVTPPEYVRLSPFLSIDRINAMAKSTIQKSKFHIVCLGMGERQGEGEILRTFFLVVQSEELARIRQSIAREYLQAGGITPAFIEPYNPHITVGFTDRDLHRSDGISKNSSSCVSQIVVD